MNILSNYQNINKSVPVSKNNVQNANSVSSKIEYKPDVMDIFSKKVVNKRDLTDMVTTPRAIFKGYLCFTAGTAINAIAGFIKNEKIANPLKILGSVISVYGTFNFVKPYLIKNTELTKSEK